jgi:hypothetical protein
MHILIVTHARESRPLERMYTLGLVAERWRKTGHRVDVVRGTKRRIPADLAISHVDLTRIPAEYADFLASYPRSWNTALADISKRSISRNLVERDDAWNGPVIVKTDLNCRATSEILLLGFITSTDRWRFVPRPISSRLRHRLTPGRSPFSSYQLFASKSDIPDQTWDDERLVVERFLPEREGGLYRLRKCHFLGSRHVNTLIRGREPIVRGLTALNHEELPAPPELLEIRARLRLDYGRIDYGIVEGRIVVYDVNKTPSIHYRNPRLLSIAERLAEGL